MAPAWWVTWMLIAMYGMNAVWLACLGMWWAAGYWVSAGLISICAMNGFTR